MPYLPVDLDAKRRAAMIDAALGLSRHWTIGGLLEAWEFVWRTKEEIVQDSDLDAWFGTDQRMRAQLVRHEFLASEGPDRWRVRGAPKWLFGQAEKGAMGGKKTAESGKSLRNLKQNTPKQNRSTTEAGSEAPTEAAPKPPPKPTHHPAPNTIDSKTGRPPENPEGPPLGERLCGIFVLARGVDYQPTPADAEAMRNLLRLSSGVEDEIARRYALGLRRKRFPLITTWVDLSKHWMACATPEPEAFAAKVGRATEAEKDHDKAPPKLQPNGDIAL